MGQANTRGTYEERKAQSILRQKAQELLKKGLENSIEQVCTNCGCPFFNEAVTVRRISVVYTPDGKDAFIVSPQKILVCNNCSTPFNTIKKEEKKDEQKTSEEDNKSAEGRDSVGDRSNDDYRVVEISD